MFDIVNTVKFGCATAKVTGFFGQHGGTGDLSQSSGIHFCIEKLNKLCSKHVQVGSSLVRLIYKQEPQQEESWLIYALRTVRLK
jgi:hypothetical protein